MITGKDIVTEPVQKIYRSAADSVRRIVEVPPAGRASDYFGHAADLPRGTRVWLLVRRSFRDKKESLKKQARHLRRRAKELGLVVVGCTKHVGSGWEPSWLKVAAKNADRHKVKILLAETTSRVVRSSFYHSSERPDAQASDQELQHAMKVTKGKEVYTMLHPDATPGEERSYQIKRGKEKSPGYVRKRRRVKAKQAIAMHNKGLSYREISEAIGVPFTTIADWVTGKVKRL